VPSGHTGTVLANGLTVLSESMPGVRSVALGAWIRAASLHESAEKMGVSHMLEHMVFKGTPTRSAKDLALALETLGGSLDAYTSREHTSYQAKVLDEHLPQAADVLADLIFRPTLRGSDLALEKKVVLEEINTVDDTPDDLVFEHLQATAFAGQSVGRSILGTKTTVRSFDAKRLRAYLARNYRAPGMVVAAAGAVHHDEVVAEAERRFCGFVGPAAHQPEPARFCGGAFTEERDLEQVHIALALEGVSQRDPSIYSLQVFTNVLGGGMSSRLFQEVRELRGLCYAIYAFHAPYADTGMFGLYAGTDAIDAPELMRVVVNEIATAADTITEAEVARAKAQMKAGLLMALESSGARAEQLARQIVIYGRPIPMDEIVARVDAVTVESARAAGSALIARSRPAVAALGPSGLDSAAAIAERLTQKAA